MYEEIRKKKKKAETLVRVETSQRLQILTAVVFTRSTAPYHMAYRAAIRILPVPLTNSYSPAAHDSHVNYTERS